MRRPPTTRSTTESTLISVVVCTRNRCELLPMSLGSLCALEANPAFRYEIIVVDNGSTDQTPMAVRDFGTAHPNVSIRYVFGAAGEHRRCAKSGISAAAGSWIAFLTTTRSQHRIG